MIIGYRRAAGKIGLTDHEEGTRGAWVEKRRALWNVLESEGHHALIHLSPFTKQTAQQRGFTGEVTDPPVEKVKVCDVLMIEFGGINMRFYGDQWAETVRMIKAHLGPIVFLCDDPDLSFPWDLLSESQAGEWSRWTVVVNCKDTRAARFILKVPNNARVVDYPMHSGVTPLSPVSLTDMRVQKQRAVYIGRAIGRTKLLRHIMESESGQYLTIAGRMEEWKGLIRPTQAIEEGNDPLFVDIPEQRDRALFYRSYKACLALYDQAHQMTGWRTGRAYHAVLAGTPVIAPVGNPALNKWTHPLQMAGDIKRFITDLNDVERDAIWRQQRDLVLAEGAKPGEIWEGIFANEVVRH